MIIVSPHQAVAHPAVRCPVSPCASLPSPPACLLQYPHRGVRELGFLPERHGVYISRWHHGSPSHRYGLYALHFVAGENRPCGAPCVAGRRSCR